MLRVASLLGRRRSLAAAALRHTPRLPLTRACSSESTPPPGPPEPPVVTGKLPPIRSVTGDLPKKLLKSAHGSPYELQHLNAFLGFSSARTHPSAYNYLLGSAGGQAIIDPEETLVAMRRTLHLLKQVRFRGGRTLFVSTQPTLARLTRVIGEQTDQFYLAKRWVPGLLTNWQKSREHVHAKLKLDPRIKAAGRVRFSDLQKQNYYRGIEHMTALPDLIFRLDDTPLYDEPAKLNVPLISVVDTDASSADVDYPIPANTKSLRFYHTLACMIVRACNDGAALRKELSAYGVTDISSLDGDGEREGGGDRGWRGGGRGGRDGGRGGRGGGDRGGGGRREGGWRTPDKHGRVPSGGQRGTSS